ncbi:protein iq-domain 1 [Phtheirospermum japonicum]|uniref:Protein iq-domain 1 n=1 Tax=Phtheirospermum japonicum TaxID=374723 RepID=A0A830DLI7_9LAMI|nr:protein iq-domain 1 [Phtheirospermum japonicum]
MGKRRAWISAVKKAIICEPKENKKNRKPRRWFGNQRSKDLNSPSAENEVVIASAHPPKEEVKLIAAENEQNRHAYSVALVTAVAAEAAVAAAHAAAEVVRLRTAASNPGRTKEEIAAIKIQTAFRGYLARRTLRALRGLVRLQSLIGGQSVKRQSAATWKCMQTVARVQFEIRARRIRMSEECSAIQRQKREKEIVKSSVSNGENWDDSIQSREQIEASIHNRQEAAMRRERALAYSYSHQQTWRNSSNQTFMDSNNPHWGWSWLERWMSARPWEKNDDNTIGQERKTNPVPAKPAKTRSPNAQRQSRSPYSPSTPKSSKMRRPPSPRGPIGPDDDSKSVNSTQSGCCRRHSIAGSSVRDDDSLASSSAVPSYMASTESARARSRLPSPLGTPDRAPVSSKKRLSFSGSPGGPRRHSGPTKTEL